MTDPTPYPFQKQPTKGTYAPETIAFCGWWNSARPEWLLPMPGDILCWVHAFNAGYFGNAFDPLFYPTDPTQYRVAFNGGMEAVKPQ